MLNTRVRVQLAIFTVVALVGVGTMTFHYLDLPNLLFGAGHYRVTVQLPSAAGLYPNANVTYRGTEVGRVDNVRLSNNGVDAVLSLKSGVGIPADLQAQVHSQSGVGEQFIELVPQSGDGPQLRDGDVIRVDKTQLPPDINSLLSMTNAGLQAIPHDDLKVAVDEAYTAVGGLGPELSRIVQGTTNLAADARAHLDALTTVIDQTKPILDTQADTSDAIRSWAANVAKITDQVRNQDAALHGILRTGPDAADQTRRLFDRLQPTLPMLLANMVSLAEVGVVYNPNLEQLLVLLPRAVEEIQGAELANRNTKQDYRGIYLSFNLNLNLPPPCSTGYLPTQQRRPASEVDYPGRSPGIMYCRVPQDSAIDVRGARNLPCETRPGKRAPTVKMCESDESYVPLNEGYNWKGDPNGTLSGQPIPQLPPEAPAARGTPQSAPEATPAVPPIAMAEYDPATGTYVGPDGRVYTQSDLAADSGKEKTWQSMLQPPAPK